MILLLFGATERDQPTEMTAFTHSSVPPCGHKKNTQPKEVALNISEQYHIDFLGKKVLYIGGSTVHVDSVCMVNSPRR